MPKAAVPAYLGEDFSDASPGMRFGTYLKLWGAHANSGTWVWGTRDEASKISALRAAGSLTPRDAKTLAALAQRQHAAALSLGRDEDLLRLEAIATAPFTTGLGNEHPLENGFAFLAPYGLPYLPGSGVKGVLRAAVHELRSGDWGDDYGWNDRVECRLGGGKVPVDLSVLDVLLGAESANEKADHLRGTLSFWDVIPQFQGRGLEVEIMTPHAGHYYQQSRARKTGDSDSPHDSGQPVPIYFLTVPPRSAFAFHVQCDLGRLEKLAPALAKSGRWKSLIAGAFEHAFQWLGFGAKTAVGYGAMKEDPEAREREEARRQAHEAARQAAEAEAERAAALAQMSPTQREIQRFLDERPNKNQSELSALLGALAQGQWTGEVKLAAAEQAQRMMRNEGKWKEQSEKKNPAKDQNYQSTLKVIAWLNGK